MNDLNSALIEGTVLDAMLDGRRDHGHRLGVLVSSTRRTGRVTQVVVVADSDQASQCVRELRESLTDGIGARLRIVGSLGQASGYEVGELVVLAEHIEVRRVSS